MVFKKGHTINVGRKRPEFAKKIAKIQRGKTNSNWKGDKVKYAGIHIWVSRYKSKPEFCEECGKKEPYDLANISGEYKRDLDDWSWLCRLCHMKSDGRLYSRDKSGQFCYNKG